MRTFLAKYPKIGEVLIGSLILLVGWFIVDMRNTYVKASDKIVTAFEDMAKEVKANTIKNAEQDIKIAICEKRS